MHLELKQSIMARFTFLLLVLLSLFSCGSNDAGFKITGSFKKPVDVQVFLSSLGIDAAQLVDSCKTDAESKFLLTGTCSEPAFYMVRFRDENIYLIVKPGDKIKLDIDNTLPVPGYYVEGSTESRLVRELISEQKKVLEEISKISIAYEQSKLVPDTFMEKKAYFDNLYATLIENHKKFTNNFIYSNPTSLATIFALYQNFGKTNQPLYDKFEDLALFNFVDSNLTAIYPNVPAVLALNRDITEIKTQQRHREYAEKILKPGRRFPIFQDTTIQQEYIDIADYNGSPIALFFFASWNKPSKNELLNLQNLQSKYPNSGLKIIGISFDSKPDRLQNFLTENNVQFPVLCDYGYWDSKYVKQFGVRAIPEILLIDKNLVIQSRELDTNELLQILEEWKKSK